MTTARKDGCTQADNFTFDIQEGKGTTPETFHELLIKWKGRAINNELLAFEDGSAAQYNEDEFCWVVFENVCMKCFGTGSIPVGGKSDKSVPCRQCDAYEKIYGKAAEQ